MEHIVKFDVGHDSGGTHGAHGLNIDFIVKGIHGAVCFVIYALWFPKFTKPYWNDVPTLPATLYCHSKKPLYEDQQITEHNCGLCDGEPCYCVSSSLNSNDAMYSLVNGGDEALWRFLDEYYLSVFCNTKISRTRRISSEKKDLKCGVSRSRTGMV